MASKKLDLSTVLNGIDRKNFNFYDGLSDEDKKLYQPFVLLRFLSSCSNNIYHEYSVQVINNLINKDFWVLTKHPELVHQLFCICSTGEKQNHRWIAPKTKKTIKWLEILGKKEVSKDELILLYKNTTSDMIYDKCLDLGLTVKEAKEYVKDYQKNQI